MSIGALVGVSDCVSVGVSVVVSVVVFVGVSYGSGGFEIEKLQSPTPQSQPKVKHWKIGLHNSCSRIALVIC